jgi:hypothetical protein
MYRGILAIVTFIIAIISWLIVLFYHRIISMKNKQLLIRIAIIIIAVIGIFSIMSLTMNGNYFTSLIPIICIVIFCAEIAFLFISRLQSFWPLIAGFFTFLSVPSIIGFCKIAYDMWDKEVDAGSAGYSELSLAGVHIWFIIMCIILALILIIRLLKRSSEKLYISASGSIVFLICISVSFFYTVPRSGDEGVLLWMFLAPAFMLADLILLITILIFTISSIIRQRNENHKTNMFQKIPQY